VINKHRQIYLIKFYDSRDLAMAFHLTGRSIREAIETLEGNKEVPKTRSLVWGKGLWEGIAPC
jgi:hypothetical protein